MENYFFVLHSALCLSQEFIEHILDFGLQKMTVIAFIDRVHDG
jgi:hypothetical protein